MSSNVLKHYTQLNPELYLGSSGSFASSPLGDRTPASTTTTPQDLLTSPPRKDKRARSSEHSLREPLPTLQRTFSSYTSEDLSPLLPYLQRVCYPAGHTLWRQNDAADGLYIIEKGVLRALYVFKSWGSGSGLEAEDDDDGVPHIEESMVSGTLAGELTALSNMPRNATMMVERDVVLWKLTRDALGRMQADEPAFARMFVEAVLKGEQVAVLRWTTTDVLDLACSGED